MLLVFVAQTSQLFVLIKILGSSHKILACLMHERISGVGNPLSVVRKAPAGCACGSSGEKLPIGSQISVCVCSALCFHSITAK